MPTISDYVASLPMIDDETNYTKKHITEKKRKFLRKRAKLARKITRKNRK